MFTVFGITYIVVYLSWIVSVPTHSLQCNQGGLSGKFDWMRKDDINLDVSRYPTEWYAIDCQLQNNTSIVSLWKDDGKLKKEIVADQHKVKEFNHIFNITNLTFHDRGRYYCKACNRKDKSVGYIHMMSGGKAYQTPEILNKSKSNVSYGSTVKLDCEVTGWYEMNWSKNDKSLEANVLDVAEWRGKMRITKKRLIIEKFTEENDGLYTCTVARRNVGWRATDHISLKAKEVKPELKKKGEEYIIDTTTTSIVLRGTVEKSYPPAVFEWSVCIHVFHNCRDSTDWLKQEGNSSKEESMLIITKQESKKVSYRCIAKNKLGKDSLVWMAVNKNGTASMKPRITKTPQFETARDHITIVCESNGSVVMDWMKQLEKLPSKNISYERNGFHVTRKILEIRNFTKMDEGLYECQVKVDKYNWSDYDKINISMKVKPKIIIGNSKLLITFKRGMELKCELFTKAVPKAEIRWSRCVCDDDDCSECNVWLKLQNTSTQESNELLNKLIIQKLTSDRVIYRCMASNDAGYDELKWIVLKGLTDSTQEENKVLLIIILCTALVCLCILLIIVVFLYKRRIRYGGFFLINSPPEVADRTVKYEKGGENLDTE